VFFFFKSDLTTLHGKIKYNLTVVLESRDENITVVMKITNNTVFFNIFIHYYITSCSNVVMYKFTVVYITIV